MAIAATTGGHDGRSHTACRTGRACCCPSGPAQRVPSEHRPSQAGVVRAIVQACPGGGVSLPSGGRASCQVTARPPRWTHHGRLGTGSPVRSVPRTAGGAPGACGSRPRPPRRGRGGMPAGSPPAVAETRATARASSPYQPRPVAVGQRVAVWATPWAQGGRRWPGRRGRPVCRGGRGGAGAYRAASHRQRVMPQRGWGRGRTRHQRVLPATRLAVPPPARARAPSGAPPGPAATPRRCASGAAAPAPQGRARRARGPASTARPRAASPTHSGPPACGSPRALRGPGPDGWARTARERGPGLGPGASPHGVARGSRPPHTPGVPSGRACGPGDAARGERRAGQPRRRGSRREAPVDRSWHAPAPCPARPPCGAVCPGPASRHPSGSGRAAPRAS
jgi:hypothetical protein